MASLLKVKVQAHARKPGVEKIAEGEFKVRVAAAPEKGKANKEVLERLAAFLDVAPSRLTIVRGETSSNKLIKMSD